MEDARSEKSLEICILAGGLSSRMGRDKSKLRLGGKALLSHIRKTAKTLNLPVRIIRRDLVSRCGPIGGIYTALKTTSAEAVLFLACDMPQVSGGLLEKLWQRSRKGCDSVFIWNRDTAGFPFVLNQRALPAIEKLLADRNFSLQYLARKIRAKKFRPSRACQSDLLNVNTPKEWAQFQKVFPKKKRASRGATCQSLP